MAPKTISPQQLAEAEKLFQQARSRLSDLKAQAKKQEKSEQRILDNRRKILLGAWAFSLMQTDADFKALAFAGLDKFLTREIDRAAFPELLHASPKRAS